MQVSSSGDNTYTSASYSNKGVSGMVSGLDTEGLVKSMLSDIQTKIDKQEQQQKVLEMKQEEYRDVIDKINEFKDKYLTTTGEKSIFLSSTFNSSTTESNSPAVKATATTNSVEGSFSVEVTQLAEAAKFTSPVSASSSQNIKLDSSFMSKTASNESIAISVQGRDFDIDISGAVSESDIVDRINAGIASYNKINGTDISISASLDSDKKIVYSASGADTDFTVNGDGVTIKNAEITSSALDTSKLGDGEGSGKDYKFKINDQEITINLTKDETVDNIAGKLNDALNGTGINVSADDGKLKFSGEDTTEKITIEAVDDEGHKDDLTKLGLKSGTEALRTSTVSADSPEINLKGKLSVSYNGVSKSITITDTDNVDSFKDKLYNAFGSGIRLDGEGNITAGTGKNITIGGSKDALEYIGLTEKGAANQLSTSKTLADIYGYNENDDIKFTINGTDFNFKGNAKLSDMMAEVNDSRAGVTFTYNSLNDKFSIKSDETGADAVIDVNDGSGRLIEKMFGTNTIHTEGKDAQLKIDGEDVSYSGNDVTYNGINLTLKSVTNGAVNIETSKDVDKALDTVVSFVEDYNKLIEDLNKRIHEKAEYKKYPPLTDAQEDEMSDKEIEKWNEKTKTGLLNGDSDISRFLQEMRAVLYTKVGDSKMLDDIGIKSSSDWKDYGKLTINKDQLTEALETDMDGVADIFTGKNGIASRLNTACKKAANTSSGSPGSLVTLAGIKGKATEKNNTITKRINAHKEKMAKLKEQYEARKQRYWKQFNSMESALSQMNSTSTWLASMLGG